MAQLTHLDQDMVLTKMHHKLLTLYLKQDSRASSPAVFEGTDHRPSRDPADKIKTALLCRYGMQVYLRYILCRYISEFPNIMYPENNYGNGSTFFPDMRFISITRLSF